MHMGKRNIALLCSSALSSLICMNSAGADATFYTVDSSNSTISTIHLTQDRLGNSTLSDPSRLTVSDPATGHAYKYVAVQFTPTENGTLQFGMTSSPVDTIMVLYDGIFDPLNPGSGAKVGNDDTSATKHRQNIGDPNLNVRCGSSTSFCPLIGYNVSMGQTYTLWVSVYDSSYNNSFDVPFDFYSTGSVVFGQYTGRSPIDTMQPYYLASELGVSVDPIFVGGTLKMDQAGTNYSQDFTLANMSTNTIDLNGLHPVFNGVFSDASGQAGNIIIQDSASGGAVTFNGNNTFTGKMTVKNTTLNVKKAANMGAASATLELAGSTLNASGSFVMQQNVILSDDSVISVANNKTVTVQNIVSGTGALNKTGDGTLILNAANRFSAKTTVSNGSLIIGDSAHMSASLAGDLEIKQNTRAGGYGSIRGKVINNGLFAVGSAMPGLSAGPAATVKINGRFDNLGILDLKNDVAGDHLTINGNYYGAAGSQIAMDVHLRDDAAPTDFIHIKGNATGSSDITVKNTNGKGWLTTGDGIRIIQVDGSADQDTFVLRGDFTTKSGASAVTAGAYAYTLWQHSKTNPNDGGWYLRSEGPPNPPEPSQNQTPNAPSVQETLYNPLVPVVEAYPQTVLDLMELDSYRQRRGGYAQGGYSPDNDYADEEGSGDSFEGALMWARMKGKNGSATGSQSTAGISRDYQSWTLRSGADGVLFDDGDQSLSVGANVVYGQNKNELVSKHGDGSIQTFAWGVGGGATWRGMKGAYIDVQGQVLWHSSDLRSDQLGTLVEENTGLGYSGSVEFGRQVVVGEGLTVTPQMQLSYYNVDFQNFRDARNVRVALREGQRMTGRLGVSVDKHISWEGQNGDTRNAQFFGILNLYQHLVEKTTVNVAEVDIKHEAERTWGGIGFGSSYSWDNDRYNILGEFNAKSAFENMSDNYELSGTVRARVKW